MIKKILVSQPKPTSEKSPYFDIAKRFDVELVFRPFIKVEGITSKEFRAQKVSILDYTAVVFTSSGVKSLLTVRYITHSQWFNFLASSIWAMASL